MKTTLTVLFLLFTSAAYVSAQNSIHVKITNIREARGNILVAVFNNEGDFLEKAVQVRTIKAAGPEVTVVIENLPAGDYALSIIHDENTNGELDKNMMGIPKEGFGFGNNSMGTFGPPSFDKAKVTLNGKRVLQELTLRYM